MNQQQVTELVAAMGKSMAAKGLGKTEQAVGFVWLLQTALSIDPVPFDRIVSSFAIARLPPPNTSRLRDDLKRDRRTISVRGGEAFQLHTNFTSEWDADFGVLIRTPPVEHFEFDLKGAPLLSQQDTDDAKEMATLYSTLFLLENSMRKFVATVLTRALGADWWDAAASSSMKRKHADRLTNENSKKWMPARAAIGPLFALDWPDLLTLMRKYESHFVPHLGDIAFLHRFEDLGQLRNVIAHNGVVDDQQNLTRVKLAYSDWCRQLKDFI